MQLQRRVLTAAGVGGGLALVLGCTVAPTPAGPTVSPRDTEASVPAGPPSPVAWTWQRAADPELVHLHIQAPAAPGAFLVPWLEGITLRPCAIVVHDGERTVQQTELSYDTAGRLIAVTSDAGRDALERDARGRLLRARGLDYHWVEGRLASVTEAGAVHREHVLHYDDRGRLAGIDSSIATPNAEPRQVRQQWLLYDEDLLVERRWRDDDGAHGKTYFVYDAQESLVRVDVESTDAAGSRIVQPTVRLEYRDSQLVEFGDSTVDYDDEGRARGIASIRGVRTDYRYRCD